MPSHNLALPLIGRLTPFRRSANLALREEARPQMEGKPAAPLQVVEKIPVAASQGEGLIKSEALLERLGLASMVATRQLNFFMATTRPYSTTTWISPSTG